jgi:hypothetical protein
MLPKRERRPSKKRRDRREVTREEDRPSRHPPSRQPQSSPGHRTFDAAAGRRHQPVSTATTRPDPVSGSRALAPGPLDPTRSATPHSLVALGSSRSRLGSSSRPGLVRPFARHNPVSGSRTLAPGPRTLAPDPEPNPAAPLLPPSLRPSQPRLRPAAAWMTSIRRDLPLWPAMWPCMSRRVLRASAPSLVASQHGVRGRSGGWATGWWTRDAAPRRPSPDPAGRDSAPHPPHRGGSIALTTTATSRRRLRSKLAAIQGAPHAPKSKESRCRGAFYVLPKRERRPSKKRRDRREVTREEDRPSRHPPARQPQSSPGHRTFDAAAGRRHQPVSTATTRHHPVSGSSALEPASPPAPHPATTP